MGWTSTNYQKGLTVPQFFYGPYVNKSPEGYDEYHGNYPDEVTQVAASGLIGRTEFYAVIRFKNKHTNHEWRGWFLAVYMVKWSREDRYGHNFGYKDMEESMGPTICNAPLKVLKAAEELCPMFDLDSLSPEDRLRYDALDSLSVIARAENNHSVEWELLNKKRELDPDAWRRDWRRKCYERFEGRTPVKVGDVIQFARPIRFTSGDELDTFWVEYSGRNSLGLVSTYHGGSLRYKIPNWRSLPFEVVDHKETPGMRNRRLTRERLEERVQELRASGYPKAKIVRGEIVPGPLKEAA